MSLLDRFVVRDRSTETEDVLARRLSVVPTPDLPLWVDNTISHLGKAVQAYLREGDGAQLEEAKIAANSLVSLLDELERRTT